MYRIFRHMQTEAKEKVMVLTAVKCRGDDLIIRRRPAQREGQGTQPVEKECSLGRTQARLKRVFCRLFFGI